MRASRLLSLLLLLQNRGRMTARQLADELEVSIRTIYRDIDSLSAAGIPVYADRGPDGGYRLLDGYRTRLTGLTSDEADSLFLTGVPVAAAELGLGSVLAAAELKLLAALTPESRIRAGRIRERFHLDAPPWFREPDRTPHLADIAEAVWNERQVKVRYRRWKHPQEVARVLDPLGVVLKAGRWYLVAAAEENIRTYRVARLLETEILPSGFTRPAAFDLVTYWQEWAERFEADVYRGYATILIDPEIRSLLFLLPTAMARAAIAALDEGPTEADGRVKAVVPIESVKHARVEFLRLGAGVEVVEPVELRDTLAAAARDLLRRYDRSG